MEKGGISKFIERHFLHFNAATLIDAAKAYERHLQNNGKMFFTMAGAMSSAELGRSMAEMIRQDKIHAICCTGANLEEDIYNLVAYKHYVRVPNYRELSPQQEQELLERHLNRVTDTCIPESEAMRVLESELIPLWEEADKDPSKRKFPHENIYSLIRSKKLEKYYQTDPRDSWMVAACEKNLPIFVPGWEDSTSGNIFAARCLEKTIRSPHAVKGGIEYMLNLAEWYIENSGKHSIGFFQIGGGIAGDFPICVVPMLTQDLHREVPCWGYFCQISDSTTSYGSYSGATPNEKITWGKLTVKTPKFIIESDASIVAPLMFAYLLGW